MISDSDKYVALQNVYKHKAQHDTEAVMTRVERLLLNINKPYDSISENEVKLYCKHQNKILKKINYFLHKHYYIQGKNSFFLKMIDYRPLSKEYDPQTSNIAALMGKKMRINLSALGLNFYSSRGTFT